MNDLCCCRTRSTGDRPAVLGSQQELAIKTQKVVLFGFFKALSGRWFVPIAGVPDMELACEEERLSEERLSE